MLKLDKLKLEVLNVIFLDCEIAYKSLIARKKLTGEAIR